MFWSLGPKIQLLPSHGFKLRMAAGVVVTQLLLQLGTCPLSFNHFGHGLEPLESVELMLLQEFPHCLTERCDPQFRGVGSWHEKGSVNCYPFLVVSVLKLLEEKNNEVRFVYYFYLIKGKLVSSLFSSFSHLGSDPVKISLVLVSWPSSIFG